MLRRYTSLRGGGDSAEIYSDLAKFIDAAADAGDEVLLLDERKRPAIPS